MTSFTAEQRKELQLQRLIFNCIAFGCPIPAYLFFLFRMSFVPTKLLPHPNAPSWIRQRAGRFDRNEEEEEDAEPRRCSNTKLAASNEYEFKYCERHEHRESEGCSRKRAALTPPLLPPSLPLHSVYSNWMDAYKFSIGLSTENTACAFRNQDGARDKPSVCPRPEDDKADGWHCFVMGVDLKAITTAEAEKKKEEKRIEVP